jgi:hypothetical protein
VCVRKRERGREGDNSKRESVLGEATRKTKNEPERRGEERKRKKERDERERERDNISR